MARSSWRGKKALLGASALVALLAALAAGDGFQFLGPLSRVLTPNGPNNQNAIFCLSNPSDSGVRGDIYTLLGRRVASMTGPIALAGQPQGNFGCPVGGLGAQYIFWDGRSNGNVVHGGIYVYEIRSEGHAYTGTLVVVR